MESNFKAALKKVLVHEGGWADHPKDPGGATMRGVTLATFRRYINPKATKDDLRRITDAQLAATYKRHYWDAVKADDLPSGVDYAVFDFAVNSGPGRAARYLQACIGAPVDGAIGPKTVAACKQLPADQIIDNLCDDRMEFLRALKTWKTFGKGWTSRVTGVRKEALLMAVDAHAPATAPKPAPTSHPAPAASGGLLAILINLFKAIFGAR